MAFYFGTTEITNIDNLVPQSGLDIADLWFGETNVYTVWQTYEGALPATINANGADLKQYRIYGNTSGVGEEVNITGLSEPLCGVGTYADSLDLSTGILTRIDQMLVLTGEENWTVAPVTGATRFSRYVSAITGKRGICSHYKWQAQTGGTDHYYSSANYLFIFSETITTEADFKSYLAAQYAAGTPVTVWYVLANPKVSTIIVPSGLTGTIEGYLIQDGTPTPKTPIYPTANGEKQADDTYSIKYGYKLDMSTSDGTNATVTPIYIGSDPLDKDEYVDYQTGKVFRRTAQVMPSAPAETKTSNGITITCDGEGRYSISGTATSYASIRFDISEFTTPASVASGGQGTLSIFNDFANPSIALYFMQGSVSVDDWRLTPANRVNTVYSVIGNKTINGIIIGVSAGVTINGVLSPMFTDNGVLPETYAPYYQPTDPPVPLPALPTCEGTTIVDYAGSGTVPEKVLLKYRKEGY